MSQDQHPKTFLEAVTPYIKGCQISVYLLGRQAPMTELTVCDIYPHVLVARANSSTHLINPVHISAIRFANDCEPGRNPDHPLYNVVAQKPGGRLAGGRDFPGGPRNTGAHK